METEGVVFWLPPRADIQSNHYAAIDSIDPNWFEHPVLLVHQVNSDEALFCLITTWPSRGRRLDWSQFVPLSPSQAHPQSGMLLTFENAAALDRPSWARLELFQTSLDVVQKYHLRPRRNNVRLKLDQASLKYIQRALAAPHSRLTSQQFLNVTIPEETRTQLSKQESDEAPRWLAEQMPYRWSTQMSHDGQNRIREWNNERALLLPIHQPSQAKPASDETGTSAIFFGGLAILGLMAYVGWKISKG